MEYLILIFILAGAGSDLFDAGAKVVQLLRKVTILGLNSRLWLVLCDKGMGPPIFCKPFALRLISFAGQAKCSVALILYL